MRVLEDSFLVDACSFRSRLRDQAPCNVIYLACRFIKLLPFPLPQKVLPAPSRPFFYRLPLSVALYRLEHQWQDGNQGFLLFFDF